MKTKTSPVTNLLALREFSGLRAEQVHDINIAQLAEKLAGRPIWLSMNDILK